MTSRFSVVITDDVEALGTVAKRQQIAMLHMTDPSGLARQVRAGSEGSVR